MTKDPFPYRTNRDLFSNYYLKDHLRQTEPWNRVPESDVEAAYSKVCDLWEEKQDRVDDYNEAQLQKNFIDPIFEILDVPFEIEETVMRNARRPDYGFFPSDEAADAAFDRENFYEEAIAVADAKRWDRKLDTRGEEKRDFENPSYQIHRYLQETTPQWAVLTNGRHWRLYYGPTSHRLDSYYEIDLPQLLDHVAGEGDLEDFRDFYLFFRQGAFQPDQSGDCFLDDVYDQSSVFAEEIGENLQENIYEAIRVMAEGFLETNDDLDRENLELVHDSSLIYLYRLIFILYAESEGRNLLPTNNEIYSSSYSLNKLKETVFKKRNATQQHYQSWQTNLWDRLEELFVLIDEGSQGMGIPKDDLYIPAYNGGLFRTNPDADDSEESRFLADHEVGDAYLAEVIELLTRHEASDRTGKVFVDYSSLDERNLGSIYEGLLEYKLDVADKPLTVDDGEYVVAGEGNKVEVDEGEVYLRTDDGERKATGSYYTPEYIVEYIVDETLGPLIDEIKEDLLAQSARGDDRGFAEQFADRVFDLTVLDPAMGSGHFPVNAVDYLAREIINAQEKQDRQAIDSEEGEVLSPMTEEGELRDINWARRKVAQRCIYGVDINPLATELAKVSLWLRTLAAEQPLAFLDHHLKTGNSLVGSDIEEVLSDNDNGTEDGQLTLEQSFRHIRQQAMEHVTDRFQELLAIDNETLADIKEMEEVYSEVRKDPLYQKLIAMVNVHTAAEFGLEAVPDDADKRMAEALRSESWEEIEEKEWFKSSQLLADEERFFHWELEFPVAFYDEDGNRRINAGFDAIIGNPPYVRQENIKNISEYLNLKYEVYDGRGDIYIYFFENALELIAQGNDIGFISSNRFLTADYGAKLRDYLDTHCEINQIIDFGDLPVFDGVTTYPAIVILTKSDSQTSTKYLEVENLLFDSLSRYVEQEAANVDSEQISGEDWSLRSAEAQRVLNQLGENTTLGEYVDGEINYGVKTGFNDAFVISEEKANELINQDENSSELIKKFISGSEIRRYHHYELTDYLIYSTWETDIDKYPAIKEHLSNWKDELESRPECQQGRFDWHCLARYAPESKKDFSEPKIVYPEVSKIPRFSLEMEGAYPNKTVFTIPEVDYWLLGILNSNMAQFYLHSVSSMMRGGYYMNSEIYVEDIPLPSQEATAKSSDKLDDITLSSDSVQNVRRSRDEKIHLDDQVRNLISWKKEKGGLNLNLLDYLGNYKEGPKLPDIGLFQPAGSDVLNATTEDYEKLRVSAVRTEHDGSTVTVSATARYKPNDGDAHETDQWGYTETEFQEAFTVMDLSKGEAALVEAFVPVAVEKEIGGFRNHATKNISLIDRLKGITLLDPDDVADDLQRYIQTKERAKELDEKIEKTDQLIDEIVYDLYDLTDEEIKIVEEAVTSH